jgi:hypothetical protein
MLTTRKMKKTILASVLSFIILFSFGAFVAYAQPTGNVNNPSANDPGNVNNPPDGNVNNPPDGNVNNPDGLHITPLGNPFKTGSSLEGFLNNLIDNLVFPIGGILAVLAFIYSGFLYVMARGNSTKISEANKALLYTAIGTAVLLGARIISAVVGGTVQQLQ